MVVIKWIKDRVQNWGGLLEPYWIGINEFGAQSIRVDNKAPIPLAVSVESEAILFNDWENHSNRQLCLASDYIRSNFNNANNEQISGSNTYSLHRNKRYSALEYELCLGDNAIDLQKDFFNQIDRFEQFIID